MYMLCCPNVWVFCLLCIYCVAATSKFSLFCSICDWDSCDCDVAGHVGAAGHGGGLGMFGHPDPWQCFCQEVAGLLFGVLTGQILYPGCGRVHHFASPSCRFWSLEGWHVCWFAFFGERRPLQGWVPVLEGRE